MDQLTLFDKIAGGGLLAGKKTYLAAAGLAVTGVIAWLAGDASRADLMVTLTEAGGIAGLRHGVSKMGAGS